MGSFTRIVCVFALALPALPMTGCVPFVVGRSSRTLEHVEGPLGPSGAPADVVERSTDIVVLVAFPPSIWSNRRYVALLDDPHVYGKTRADDVSAKASKYLRSLSRRTDDSSETALARALWDEIIDQEDGAAHTHVVVSYDPIVVVVLPTPIAYDNAYLPDLFGGKPVEGDGPVRPLGLASGFLATYKLGPIAPIAWYSPTRRSPLRALDMTDGSPAVLDTGKEQFIIEPRDEEWSVRRGAEDEAADGGAPLMRAAPVGGIP